MKKSTILICLAALSIVACKPENPAEVFPTPEAGASYTFQGTVATDGFTWNSASIIGVYGLTEGVKVANAECRIEGYAIPVVPEEGEEAPVFVPSKWEGQASAPFISPAMDLVKGHNEFLVYTPYNEEMTYIPSQKKIYNLSVSDSQVQPAPNVAGACFALGVIDVIPGKDEVFPFTLNPVTAMLKINISTSEFAGYGVKKVTIIDESESAKLGGTFDVVLDGMEFTTFESTSKVATTITASKPMTAGETQSVFVNILPGDFSATEFTILIEMSSDKGNVTIPLKKKGVKCEAGKTAELNITDLKSSDNIYEWYCPVENRSLAGCNYAYGDANTYLIQCKSAVYAGSVVPNADIPSEVVIDYRLRGDFTQGEAPVDVTFEWATLNNGNIYLPRHDNKFKPDGLVFEANPANFTVKVTNNSATAGAPILIMKNKEGKILWGWAFWNIAADGTKLEAVNVNGYKLANMSIGQATTDLKNWLTACDNINRTVYYYQWGRYLPIFWNSYWTCSFIGTASGQPVIEQTGGNVAAIQGPFATIRESLDYPYGAITHYDTSKDVAGQKTAVNMTNWTDELKGDLWGGVVGKSDEAGTKSIYDPCPKGWRVADHDALKAIETIVGTKPSTYEETTGAKGLNVGDLYLSYSGYVDYKNLPSSSYRPTNYGGATTWSSGMSTYWTNYCASHNANSPFAYRYYGSNSSNESKFGQMIRSAAMAVRCQKDDDAR